MLSKMYDQSILGSSQVVFIDLLKSLSTRGVPVLLCVLQAYVCNTFFNHFRHNHDSRKPAVYHAIINCCLARRRECYRSNVPYSTFAILYAWIILWPSFTRFDSSVHLVHERQRSDARYQLHVEAYTNINILLQFNLTL